MSINYLNIPKYQTTNQNSDYLKPAVQTQSIEIQTDPLDIDLVYVRRPIDMSHIYCS